MAAERDEEERTWSERRYSQARTIKKAAPTRGRFVYWLLWSVPWAVLLVAAWFVAKMVALGARVKKFFVEDIRQAPGKVRAGVEASGQELSSRKGRRALARALF